MQANNIWLLLTNYEKLIDQLERIAQDARTPSSVLEKLSRLTDCQITASVMLNPSTPSHILEKELRMRPGVGGTDEEARIHICYNPALRLSTLKALIKKDPAPTVRAAAKRALAIRDQRGEERKKEERLRGQTCRTARLCQTTRYPSRARIPGSACRRRF